MLNRRTAIPVIAIVLCFGGFAAPLAAQDVEVFPLNDFEPAFALVRIGDKTANLVIDTGATRTVVDDRFKDQLGAEVNVVTFDSPVGAVEIPIHECRSMFLGRRQLAAMNIGCVDVGKAFEGEGVDGFLGMDVLAAYCIDLDWDQHEVRLSKNTLRKREPGSQRVALRFDQADRPTVDFVVSGADHWELLVDTGSSGGLSICDADKDSVLKKHANRSLPITSTVLAGEARGSVFRCPEVMLGDARFQDVLCKSFPAPYSSRHIGVGFFRYFRTRLNLPMAEVEFSPRESAFENEADMSGLHFLRIDGELVIKVVDPASPAADAGVLKGDKLIAINGDSTRNVRPARIRAILRHGDGVKISLRVVRDGVEKDFEFALRKQI